jgi:hypothetical protein
LIGFGVAFEFDAKGIRIARDLPGKCADDPAPEISEFSAVGFKNRFLRLIENTDAHPIWNRFHFHSVFVGIRVLQRFNNLFREASQHEVDAMRAAIEATPGSATDRIAIGIETFARRALRGRRLAWALLAEPVDPAVEAERLHFRHSYRDLMSEVITEGIEAGELPAQDVDATAAALIGAIGETMLGPLSPTTNGGDPDALIASLINFCTRAIGEEPAHVDR